MMTDDEIQNYMDRVNVFENLEAIYEASNLAQYKMRETQRFTTRENPIIRVLFTHRNGEEKELLIWPIARFHGTTNIYPDEPQWYVEGVNMGNKLVGYFAEKKMKVLT